MTIQRMMEKLYKHYGSDSAVAEVLGVNQSTASRLRRGVTEPSWQTYQAIVLQVQLLSVDSTPDGA